MKLKEKRVAEEEEICCVGVIMKEKLTRNVPKLETYGEYQHVVSHAVLQEEDLITVGAKNRREKQNSIALAF